MRCRFEGVREGEMKVKEMNVKEMNVKEMNVEMNVKEIRVSTYAMNVSPYITFSRQRIYSFRLCGGI